MQGTHACQNPVAESHGCLHSQRSRSRRLSIQRKTDSRLIIFVCFLIPFYHLQCHLQTNCTVLLEFRCFRRRKEKKLTRNRRCCWLRTWRSSLLVNSPIYTRSSQSSSVLQLITGEGKKEATEEGMRNREEKAAKSFAGFFGMIVAGRSMLRRRPGYCACGNFARSRWLLSKCCRKTTRRDHCAATSIMCWKWTKVLAGT